MTEYINRKDVINKIAEVQEKAASGMEDVAYYRAIKIIREMPAADTQPVKHGCWKSSAYTIESGTVKCSNCRTEMYVDDLLAVSASNDNLPNYCPNCGARMDGDAK